MDFANMFQLNGLKLQKKGLTNFYECCDLTKKVYLVLFVQNRLHAQHFFVFSPDPIPKCHQSQFSGTTHLSHQKPLPLAESHLWHKTSEWCTNTISVVRHHPIKLKFPLNWHSETNSRFYWLEWYHVYLRMF